MRRAVSSTKPVSPAQAALAATGASVPLTDRIVRVLRAVRRRDLLTHLAEFPVRFAIILPLIWIVQALADWAFDLSWNTRRNLLAGDGIVLTYLFWRHAVVPYRQRLDLQKAALLVERKVPQFCTSLISALQLTARPTSHPALVQILVRQVDRLTEKTDVVRQVVHTAGLKKRAAWALLALLGFGAAGYYFHPKSLVLGQRVLLSRVAFPSLTTVEAITKDATVPDGSDFEATARAGGVVPKNGHLTVIHEDGRTETIPLVASSTKQDTFSYAFRNVRQAFRYRFTLGDGEGEEYRVTNRVFLVLSEVRFTQTYPNYTGLARTVMPVDNLALMAGGRVWIEGKATYPLKSARLTLIGINKTIPLNIGGDDKKSVTLDYFLTKDALTGFSIHLESASGEQSCQRSRLPGGPHG